MPERRYDVDEVAAIFERASETVHGDLPAPAEGEGLTLAALHEIGREVGISPESISRAARSLNKPGSSTSRTFLGLPIGVGRTVEFDRPLTDADWAALVADLRTTFEARGTIKYDGPFRQWTNGNLQALLEPTSTGHRLRLQTMKADSRARMAAGGIMMAGAAATAVAIAATAPAGGSGAATGIAFMAIVGLGMFASGALSVSRWARRRTAQIEQIIARLTDSAASSTTTASESGADHLLP